MIEFVLWPKSEFDSTKEIKMAKNGNGVWVVRQKALRGSGLGLPKAGFVQIIHDDFRRMGYSS